MDTNAMRQELLALGSGAHALATQILGNPDDARDAVQDAFTTVFAKPQAFDNERGTLRTWFLRLVRNRCIDMIRRRRSTTLDTEAMPSHDIQPDEAAELAQRDAALQAALHSLPDDQRQIIVLRDYLDLRYTEIADILEIPQGTVMSRLHRARLALGKAYEERYE